MKPESLSYLQLFRLLDGSLPPNSMTGVQINCSVKIFRPLFERMRTLGPEFLAQNAALSDEVRRSLYDLDRIEGEF